MNFPKRLKTAHYNFFSLAPIVTRAGWFMLIVVLSVTQAFSQVSTEGTDFWLGFMQNADGGQPSSLEIFITGNEPATGNIIIAQDNRVQSFSITPGTTFKYVVSNAQNNPYAASGSGNITKQGIRITSSADVSVYAFNKRNLSADATVVLPTATLGKDYIVASYYEPSGQNNIESEFLVVGTENGTTLEIIPSVTTTDGKAAGVPFSVTLNLGETLQMQALADLTGTIIRSTSTDPTDCKNFAVFGGNQWTRIGNCGGANDQLYEQLYPINTWGKNFTVVPFLGRNSNGDLYRIIASESNTSLTIRSEGGASNTTSIANVGGFLSGNVSSATSISADKPIQVVQYSKSQCAEINSNGASPGDPFMLMISPNEQMLNKVTFNTLESGVIDNYYTTIITKTASRDQTTLEGAVINSWTELSSNPDLSYARIGLARNRDYTLEAPEGFISYVYGFGVIESFGYAAGASLENLNLEVIGDDETIGIIVQEGCLNSLVDFSVEFETPVGQDPRYTEFAWDFGDGNIANGLNVTHTYTEVGTYSISMIASDGSGACGASETINRTVTITDAAIDQFSGPTSVCPDVKGVVYSVEGNAENTYTWTISGGVIASFGSGPEITVDWGAANDNASITVTPMNALGCIGETMTLDVKINKRLEPALPTGPVEVCFSDFLAVQYSTPITNGSEYEWFVQGGSFTTSNTSNEVTVQWDAPGVPRRLWYREYNPSISDCEGFSEFLDVIIYPDITVVTNVTDVLCFGDANGRVDLEVSGGKPGDYNINFNGALLNGLSIEGLSVGDYQITVLDALGCEVQVDFHVGTPDALSVTDVAVMDVRCFQEANGAVTISLQGGTPQVDGSYDYVVTGNGQTINGNGSTLFVDNLTAGDYTATFTDVNGCEISQDFFVGEPLLLEPDLETLINEPICPDASNGTASVNAKGGTPDYQFFWSNNDTQDMQEGMNFSKGIYTVRIVDANGCETSLDVEVTERFPRIFIPNAFSPNSVGENDEFKPVTDCDLVYNLKVFDRWGSIVYVNNNILEGWDGTFRGQQAPEGKYTYVVFYSGAVNGISFEEKLTGTLRLFR